MNGFWGGLDVPISEGSECFYFVLEKRMLTNQSQRFVKKIMTNNFMNQEWYIRSGPQTKGGSEEERQERD